MATVNTPPERRTPVGADVQKDGAVHFRIWAPRCAHVDVVLEADAPAEGGKSSSRELTKERTGYFSGIIMEAHTGSLYRFRLDGKKTLLPDPASRFQPQGPHGPSEVIDPSLFVWTDGAWRGSLPQKQVVYEMHIGTFTQEGTWEAASAQLHELASLGITLLEVMPVADFPGKFGWGYDGVDLYSPSRLYGRPDDFRTFVDRAHAEGIGVALDVVYNHLGPDGNYLRQITPDYFTHDYETEWGDAINFDGEASGPVREFFLSNARYWVEEFHLDGLRIDATQAFFDRSDNHILRAIVREVRAAARGRGTVIIGESEPQRAELMRPFEEGGFGMDMLWNDDFHHAAEVAVTGRTEAYFTDYLGTPQELISSTKWGYLFQGQRYKWQKKPRGANAWGIPRFRFLNYLQNHDQLPNAGRGIRLHRRTDPGRFRAITALLLLGPGTPLIFQGEEFAASTPFHYFADHRDDLDDLVDTGRKEFLAQFRSAATPEGQKKVAEPGDPSTFQHSKLDFLDRDRNAGVYRLHRDLLTLRREDPVIGLASLAGVLDGAVLADEAFVLRFFGGRKEDRLLIVNLGRELHLDPAPEPLLAPFDTMGWEILWSSEAPEYGGEGTPPLMTEENWRIPAHAAVVMKPAEGGAHGS